MTLNIIMKSINQLILVIRWGDLDPVIAECVPNVQYDWRKYFLDHIYVPTHAPDSLFVYLTRMTSYFLQLENLDIKFSIYIPITHILYFGSFVPSLFAFISCMYSLFLLLEDTAPQELALKKKKWCKIFSEWDKLSKHKSKIRVCNIK